MKLLKQLAVIATGFFLVAAGEGTSVLAQTSAFNQAQLGTPTHAGSVTLNANNTTTINGGGADIWNNADSGFYFYTTVTGLVWDARVRVLSFDGPDFWSKVELMARRPDPTLMVPSAGDPQMDVCSTRVAGANDIEYQYRGSRNSASGNQVANNLAPNYPNEWLRLTRFNTVFTFYYSTDGSNWSQFNSQDTATTANGFDGNAWENPTEIGIAVTAHNDTDANGATAVISNLTVSVTPVVPPTAASAATPINGSTNVYAFTEASFNFVATNNSTPPGVYFMKYAWFKNNQLVSTNPMGPSFTFLTTPADNGAQIYCIGMVADPNYSSVTITSAVMTLTVKPGALLYGDGLKLETFANVARQDVEIGNMGPAANITVKPGADVNISPVNGGVNYVERFTGYFTPPTNGAYVFFINSDDDSDLFLSLTDTNAANKQLVAQETQWSNPYDWLTTDAATGVASQKRSDQFTPDNGATIPYANGINLIGGQPYYLEIVHHQGGGGGNVAVTLQTTNQIADPSWATVFTNGVPSLMQASNGYLSQITWPGTNITWLAQPRASVTVSEGSNTNLSSLARSDAEMTLNYQWYFKTNGGTYGPYGGATGTNLLLSTIPASYNGAQFYVVASTVEGGLSITSSVTTLTVQQAVFEAGFLKDERWDNQGSTGPLEAGNLGVPNWTMAVPEWAVTIQNPNSPNNFVRRVTGFFVPPVTTNYTFFVTSDDDSDLFVSTDNTPANKNMVCQQYGWNAGANWPWLTVNGTGNNTGNIGQTRSDMWSPGGAGGTAPYANGIPLIAGRRYYIEQDYHQGGGGANLAATYKYVGDPDPSSGTETRLKGNVIGMNVVRCSFVAFTQQPINASAPPMGYATFSAAGITDGQTPIGTTLTQETDVTNNFLFFQWYTNGVAIPGANTSALTLGPLLPSANGMTVFCRMRALGYADSTLSPTWSNSATATLTITTQAVFEPGWVQNDWWSNATANTLVESGSIGRNPDITYLVPKFEGPNANTGVNNYVNRISGFFLPPANGLYTFFVNSDDESDLFLNMSPGATQLGKTLVAQETAWSNPFQWLAVGAGTVTQKRSDQWSPDGGTTTPYSSGISLSAGQMYWLEQVHHQGGGGDNAESTYASFGSTPNNGDDSVLSGGLIGTYVPRIPWVAFLQQPTNQTQLSGNPVTFSVQGTNPPSVLVGPTGSPFPNLTTAPLQYQWYKNGTLVAGATSSALTLTNVQDSDNGTTLFCAMRALGYVDNAGNPLWATSSVATLTVVTGPHVTGLSVPDRRDLYVYFSTNMDPVTALDPSHYTLNHSGIVTNVAFVAALGTNGPQSVVQLSLQAPLGVYSDFVLSVSNVFGSGTGGLVQILPNPTLLPFQVTYRNLGYLYLSPLPGAQYISAQNNYVLIRFSSISPAALNNLSSFVTVTGATSGAHTGTTHIASDGRTVILQIGTGFIQNELVTVSLSPQVTAGVAPDPYQYQFVIGGHLPDPPTITARGDSPPYGAKENAFDGQPATKWVDYIVPNGTSNFSWIQYLYPDSGTLVAGQYALVSAADSPERDPADWNFYGVDASTNLVLLDRQTNQVFSSRGQMNTYALSSPLAFRGYRLEITRVNNPSTASAVQLAELQFTERQGSLLREYWLNITGNAVSDLTNNSAYPASPSGSGQLSTFEAPVNWAANYGQRVRGYITAPATGPFVFWISSDDDSDLFLSTDSTPTNKTLIASVVGWTNPREWSKYSSQQSAPISLAAGQKYYVEALHKQGGGGDNLAVGWAMPGQVTSGPSQVIPMGVLSPWTGGPFPAVQALALSQFSSASSGSPPHPLAAIMPNNVSIPSDFPQITLSVRGNPSLDYIWLDNPGPSGQMYKMILDTWGNPVFYQRGGARDFKPQKNGTITWSAFTAVDNNFNYLRTYGTVNGYGTDDHELIIMKDGTYFMIGDATETVDMSRYVAGGNPNASVLDNVIQQFTSSDELIFQWRAWDYLNILGEQPFIDITSSSFDFSHMNSIGVDVDDGNILVSSRNTSECTKINRDTGEVIWRMGGAQSTLTFVNDPLNGPRNQHSFQSIGGGHYILFDDGNLHNPSVSRAVEYVVDPVAKTATLVWQFRDTPDKYAYYMGNVQRLANGNTHINWVLAAYPKAVEVDTNGVKQLELSVSPGQDLYRSFRAPWTGVVPVPYLIAESYPDNVTLIYNKFGDTNVSYYRIYGGTTPHPTNLLATTPYTLAHLSNLQNNQQYYFDVTAVSGNGTESPYSNEETVMVNLTQPGQNMLVNGDFSSGTNNWTFTTTNTAAATFNVITGACVVHITNPGTALTDIQLRQNGLKLVQGKQYYITFDGYSVGGTHTIDVKVGQDQSPFGIYYTATAAPTLTPVKQHFVYSFTMSSATDLNARLMFNMGALVHDIVLDNVSVYMAYPSQVNLTLATLPQGLTVSVDGTNYATPVSLTCATNSSHTLSAATAQLSSDGHTRFPFLSWSDSGAQTHTITNSYYDVNYVANFSTQYLLDSGVSPTNGGSLNVQPSGPWYNPNQGVSLTANPNSGFVFGSWGGVDTQSSNTAQVTMSGYRSVSASFLPLGPVVINSTSLTRLPDGRIQFGITAGPGATQVTVWATTLLSAPSWQPLATVPLSGGQGLFTESSPSAMPTRFYRVTAP